MIPYLQVLIIKKLVLVLQVKVANINAYNLGQSKAENARQQKIRENTEILNRTRNDMYQQAYQEALLTETPENAAIKADLFVSSPIAQERLRTLAAEKGMSTAAQQGSISGQQNLAARQAAQEVSKAQAILATQREQYNYDADLAAGYGDLSNKVLINGRLETGTKAQLDAQTLKKSYEKSLVNLAAQDLNISALENSDDPEVKALAKKAFAVFGTASTAASAMRPYLPADGSIDKTGLREMLKQPNKLAILKKENERRIKRGDPPILNGNANSKSNVQAADIINTPKQNNSNGLGSLLTSSWLGNAIPDVNKRRMYKVVANLMKYNLYIL